MSSKCNDLYFYGRGGGKEPHQVARALEEVSIGRQVGGNYEVWDLAAMIFSLKDRIAALEARTPAEPTKPLDREGE